MLAYFTTQQRAGGKISPARQLLFATGHFQHEYVVERFIHGSPYGGAVYAKWTCKSYKPDGAHTEILDIRDNVIGKKCKCGRSISVHNEIDLILPSLMLTGHPDMVLYVDGRYYIHEFKTLERKDINFDDLEIALAEHRLQVTFYYKIMKALKMNVSKQLVVDYVDRSNSKLWGGRPYKPIAFKPEPDEFLQPFKNRLLHVKHGIATKTLPERLCKDIRQERARACDFSVECFSRRSNKIGSKVHCGRGSGSS